MQDLPIDSIFDPERPLNIPPDKWSEIKAKRQKALEDSYPSVDEMDPLTKLDNALDGIIQYVRLFNESVSQMDVNQLPPEDGARIIRAKDLMDTAVMPYLADIVKEIDGLES